MLNFDNRVNQLPVKQLKIKSMNYIEFKAVLKKSSVKILIIGIFVLLIGLPILGANFYDESKTSYWVIGLLFVALGLLMTVKPILDISSIKSDNHPILKSIQTGTKDFIVWVYIKEITSKVEGVKVGKSNNVVIVTKLNKMIELVLNNKTSPEELIEYVKSQFPNALVGYTDENSEKVKSLFKK